MFCTKCGTQNPETSQFCRNCGSVLRTQNNKEDKGSVNNSDTDHHKHIGVNTPPYPYVISTTKLVVLGLLTFGLYYSYWFYRQFKSFKVDRNWEITPWVRALFWPLTSYTLFQKVSEAGEEYDKKQNVNAGLFTAVIIVSIIINAFFQQLLFLLIFISPLFILVPIVIGLIPTLLLITVQKRINFYWDKKYGNRLVSSPFTLRDYVIAGLGGLVMFQFIVFLIGISNFVNVLKNNQPTTGPISGVPQTPTVFYASPTMAPTNTPTPIPSITQTEQQSDKNVPLDFLGKWSGDVSQPRGKTSKYPVEITIIPGELNEPVGTSSYSTLGCGGDLYLLESTSSKIIVEERLTSGFTRCGNRVVIDLTYNNDGTLTYYFKEAGSGTATLRK